MNRDKRTTFEYNGGVSLLLSRLPHGSLRNPTEADSLSTVRLATPGAKMGYILQLLQTSFPDLGEPKPAWRFVYLSALRAEGTEQITKAVIAAEDAMFARWQEINGQPDDFQERGQLQEASDELLKIKIEKLGWPELFSDQDNWIPPKKILDDPQSHSKNFCEST